MATKKGLGRGLDMLIPKENQTNKSTKAKDNKNEKTNESDTTAKKQPKKVSKIGRNEPCPCGSGKKNKKCHGKD
mgnify:CR=1 FL=1